jgi:iron complex transport system substrate-binding protein
MTRIRSAHRTTAAVALALSACLAAAGCSREGGGTADGGQKGATRTVETYKGDVEVPRKAERVVVLDTAELDSALTLGVRPVGAARADAGSGFLGYLEDEQVKGIADVGTIGSPNLERIDELDPDLILTNGSRDEAVYRKLSAIAPTVMTESTGFTWKENFRVHAEALGREAEAKRTVAAYEARAKDLTGALGGPEKAGALEVNVVRFVEGADTRIYGDGSYIATILADVGLGRPPVVDEATAHDGLMLEISPEQVDRADAGVVFYTSYGDQEKSGEARATAGGLWKSMSAVKKGAAHRVDDELWIQGIGYTAADLILTELEQHLTR